MVRSYSRRFRRIGTESCIDSRRKAQQLQDTLLYLGEWGKMTTRSTSLLDDGQGDLFEGFQQPFGGGPTRGPLGVPGVQPHQPASLPASRCRQATTDDELHQGQHPQANAQQANQAGKLLI